MNTINLNSRDQTLALAMDPGQSAFTFSEEDFDKELTLDQLNNVNGGFIPLIGFGIGVFVIKMIGAALQIYSIASRPK